MLSKYKKLHKPPSQVKRRLTVVNALNNHHISKYNRNIGIVGAGAVGSAIASALIYKNITPMIRINDANIDVAKGVVLDLQDEAFVTGTTVEHASLTELSDCRIIVITAGVKQMPGESRLQLASRNASILKKIIGGIQFSQNSIIIIVSNPVDILTMLAQKWIDVPRQQVIGSGTYLDTQRLKVILSKKIGTSIKSIHAYVLGEHGDSQVVAWNSASVGGCRLQDFTSFSLEDVTVIEHDVKNKAYEIIQKKGATFHGIGGCVGTIVESIVLDKNDVIPISAYHPTFDVCFGWPSIVNANGVKQHIPISLNEKEKKTLESSALQVRTTYQRIINTLDN